MDKHAYFHARIRRERTSSLNDERERVAEDFLFLGFSKSWYRISDITIPRKFAGFSPLWFPQGKYLWLVYILYLMYWRVVYMTLFVLLFLPHLWTFGVVPIPSLTLLTTFRKVLAFVRIDYVFLDICNLVMIWIELRFHNFILKKWCFRFTIVLISGLIMD